MKYRFDAPTDQQSGFLQIDPTRCGDLKPAEQGLLFGLYTVPKAGAAPT